MVNHYNHGIHEIPWSFSGEYCNRQWGMASLWQNYKGKQRLMAKNVLQVSIQTIFYMEGEIDKFPKKLEKVLKKTKLRQDFGEWHNKISTCMKLQRNS